MRLGAGILAVLVALGASADDVAKAQAPGGAAEIAPGTAPEKWEVLPEMPVAALAPAASVAGDRVVVTGGMTIGGATPSIQVLDLRTLQWSEAGRLRTGRFRHKQVTLPDGRLFVVGGEGLELGEQRRPLDSCELIDADLRRSEELPPMPRPMETPTAHLLPDGRVIVIGGRIACVFDPAAKRWERPIPLHERRVEHASVLLPGGDVLVIGGMNTASLERIDVARGRSERLRVHLPVALDDTAAVVLPDGRVWVLGGQVFGGNTTERTWLVRLDRPSIEDGPPLPHIGGIGDHLVFPVGERAVLVGGETQHNRRDHEPHTAVLLGLRDLSIQPLPDTPTPHDDAAGVVVGDAVIVLGGEVSGRVFGKDVPVPVRAAHRLRLP